MARRGGALVSSSPMRGGLRAVNMRLGHCYLMMDDLQQAYTAYQSALVNLRDPKVSHSLWFAEDLIFDNPCFRSLDFGMASEYSMIAMVLWITPKKLFPR